MEKLKDLQLLQTIAQDLIEDYNTNNIMQEDCTLKEAFYVAKFG